MIYVGVGLRDRREVFRSRSVPTWNERGEAPGWALYVIGPFRTVRGASLCVRGDHSPHLQTVGEFEREAKRRADIHACQHELAVARTAHHDAELRRLRLEVSP